ncbi:MAG: putative DNA binding domain-containing protein [Verrucomicrobia bacterium]|nr:putative DNA binding domain-containing protein [Verrucomicrobiota bacterium]
MDALEIVEIIQRGEDSRHQFKRLLNNEKQAAAEMVAFANSNGGMMLLGVDDNGSLVGLSADEVARHNNLISNAASQHVRNPIAPTVENVNVNGVIVMVVTVEAGEDKPYFDSDGVIWQKSGADKRKIVAKEELRRLFQASDLLQPDEVPVRRCDVSQLNLDEFSRYYEKRYGSPVGDLDARALARLLGNLNLADGEELNLAGLLLFGRNPQRFKPAFVIKAVWFNGLVETGSTYRDSADFDGRLDQLFASAMSFIKRNVVAHQADQSVNSQGKALVPEAVWEELVVNALLHRNYLLNAPIRLFGFDDRVEIISPGSLPNHLTVEHIRAGNSSIRNSVIVSFAANGLLPYRGIGTGVTRSVASYPSIDFVDDKDRQLFRVTVRFGDRSHTS